MPSGDYEPVLSAKAWEFLNVLPKARQRRLTKLIYQLAAYPFQLGDYQMKDSTGRALENLRLEGFVITYWVDHWAKELRVLDIVIL